MKNLIVEREEKLENLPKRTTFREKPWGGFHRGDFPYNRVYRWLTSHCGGSWDSVVHKFINLQWVPVEYRTYKKLSTIVETHTFLKGKKVFYYESQPFWGRSAENEVGDGIWSRGCYYVHPITKILLYEPKKIYKYPARPVTRVDLAPYHYLVLENGVWYEMRATNPDRCREMGLRLNGTLTKQDREQDYIWKPFPDSSGHVVFHPRVVKRQLSRKELRHFGLKNTKK